MRITRNFFIHNDSLHWWLWFFSLVFLFGLLVGGEDAVYAARAGWRGKKNSASDRGLERVSGSEVAADSKRVALVIGNANYQRVKTLDNPLNDADDIARDLRRFGFTVVVGKDLSKLEMRRAIADFGRSATNADVALFFYAGHGVQSDSQNYLIPVDAEVLSEADLVDVGVNVNFPLQELDNAKSLVNIVILDACRNNDFSGKFRSTALPGLAAPSSMPKGTVIVYATGPGNVASDGNGRNGLLTAGLRKALSQGNNLNLDRVLKTASRHVETVSSGVQSPYVNGPETLKEDFYFVGSAADNASRDAAESARLADIERPNRDAEAELDVIEQRRLAAEERSRIAEAKARRESEVADPAKSIDVRLTGELISGTYRDNGDGTVTDVTTKLMWKRCTEGQTWTGRTCNDNADSITWNAAMPNGQQKPWPAFAGYNDWRVPTIEELHNLVYSLNTRLKPPSFRRADFISTILYSTRLYLSDFGIDRPI